MGKHNRTNTGRRQSDTKGKERYQHQFTDLSAASLSKESERLEIDPLVLQRPDKQTTNTTEGENCRSAIKAAHELDEEGVRRAFIAAVAWAKQILQHRTNNPTSHEQQERNLQLLECAKSLVILPKEYGHDAFDIYMTFQAQDGTLHAHGIGYQSKYHSVKGPKDPIAARLTYWAQLAVIEYLQFALLRASDGFYVTTGADIRAHLDKSEEDGGSIRMELDEEFEADEALEDAGYAQEEGEGAEEIEAFVGEEGADVEFELNAAGHYGKINAKKMKLKRHDNATSALLHMLELSIDGKVDIFTPEQCSKEIAAGLRFPSKFLYPRNLKSAALLQNACNILKDNAPEGWEVVIGRSELKAGTIYLVPPTGVELPRLSAEACLQILYGIDPAKVVFSSLMVLLEPLEQHSPALARLLGELKQDLPTMSAEQLRGNLFACLDAVNAIPLVGVETSVANAATGVAVAATTAVEQANIDGGPPSGPQRNPATLQFLHNPAYVGRLNRIVSVRVVRVNLSKGIKLRRRIGGIASTFDGVGTFVELEGTSVLFIEQVKAKKPQKIFLTSAAALPRVSGFLSGASIGYNPALQLLQPYQWSVDETGLVVAAKQEDFRESLKNACISGDDILAASLVRRHLSNLVTTASPVVLAVNGVKWAGKGHFKSFGDGHKQWFDDKIAGLHPPQKNALVALEKHTITSPASLMEAISAYRTRLGEAGVVLESSAGEGFVLIALQKLGDGDVALGEERRTVLDKFRRDCKTHNIGPIPGLIRRIDVAKWKEDFEYVYAEPGKTFLAEALASFAGVTLEQVVNWWTYGFYRKDDKWVGNPNHEQQKRAGERLMKPKKKRRSPLD